MWAKLLLFNLNQYSFSRIGMSWNIGDRRNLILKLKKKSDSVKLYRQKQETRPKKYTNSSTNARIARFWNDWVGEEIFCLKLTIYNGRRKLCVSHQIELNKLNIVVYRYQNNVYLKDLEMELKRTENKKLFSERGCPLRYTDVFFEQCIVLDETTVPNRNRFRPKGILYIQWAFFDCNRN